MELKTTFYTHVTANWEINIQLNYYCLKEGERSYLAKVSKCGKYQILLNKMFKYGGIFRFNEFS